MRATDLELQAEAFFPHLFANDMVSIIQVTATSFRFAGFLWRTTGLAVVEDRATWSARQWQNHLANPALEFYAVYADQEPAGCCEIARGSRLMLNRGGTARINAFGLIPEFVGEGMAPALLTRVVEKALATGAKRVVLGTDATQLPAHLIDVCRKQGFAEPI